MYSVGNDELRKPIEKTVICPHCGEEHDVEFGKNAETGEISELLAFYKCNKTGKAYLYGLDGKQLPRRTT